jgi:zinc transport system ATP-binding protein
MSAIEVKNISYNKHKKTILENINFSLNIGDYVGLIGPNGAGKTTLIKIILGLLPPSKGSIEKATGLTIGYVPQSYTLSPIIPISVMEVLRMSGNRNLADYKNALQQVNLETSILKWNFHNLSAGQQQRIIIARALCSHPQVLIFDEPLSGVDFSTKIKLYDLLSMLNQEHNLTILFVSHEVERIIDTCHHVLCLNKTLHQGCHPLDFSQGRITCTTEYKSQSNDNNRLIPIHHHHRH